MSIARAIEKVAAVILEAIRRYDRAMHRRLIERGIERHDDLLEAFKESPVETTRDFWNGHNVSGLRNKDDKEK